MRVGLITVIICQLLLKLMIKPLIKMFLVNQKLEVKWVFSNLTAKV